MTPGVLRESEHWVCLLIMFHWFQWSCLFHSVQWSSVCQWFQWSCWFQLSHWFRSVQCCSVFHWFLWSCWFHWFVWSCWFLLVSLVALVSLVSVDFPLCNMIQAADLYFCPDVLITQLQENQIPISPCACRAGHKHMICFHLHGQHGVITAVITCRVAWRLLYICQ